MNKFVFKHPFTATVSGPTSCGKTYFIKMLLQNCYSLISPTPNRIIWMYKRWQPLYDEIKTTVFPLVKFIQGIPLGLDQDSFINPKMKNVIILDDLMSVSSKDPRITELFTEGSHHRNLSVIAINQNLFYNKDPTQRRNCHYLILFNNPIDKQQVMSLSRQMYPENPYYLINHFKQATSKPYGYLVVDLKPTTPEHKRLQSNILASIQSKKGNQYSQIIDSTVTPLPDEAPRDKTCISNREIYSESRECEETPQNNISIKPSENVHSSLNHCQDETSFNRSDMDNHSCKYCGVVFTNMYTAYRHMHRNCQENKKRLRDVEDVVKNQTFQKLVKRARKDNEENYSDMIDEYIEKGLTKKEAEEKAEAELTDSDFDVFIDLYKRLLSYIVGLQQSDIHNDMVDEIDELVDSGRSLKSSINRVVKKEYFEDLFEGDSDSESDDESNDDTESDSEEADDESNDDTESTSEEADDEDSDYGPEDNIPLSRLQF